MLKKILFLTTILTFFVLNSAAQNRFEGYNLYIEVPTDQLGQSCAIRYSSPQTDVVIKDLNPSTPTNIRPCGGSTSRVTEAGNNSAVARATNTDYKWCFEGEDDMYQITFDDDKKAYKNVYNWIANPKVVSGRYNVKDFGAKGDGASDDTIAIKSALAFIANQSGGVLFFPPGDYLVGNTPDYRPIGLPSGVTIEGVSGINTQAPTNFLDTKSPSRITLAGKNRALFRIGECTENVVMKDIELFAQSDDNTYGIEATGVKTSSTGFVFDRVSFTRFYRGVYAHGLPQNNLQWQFDYVKFNNCRFVLNRDAGIYTNILNSSWKVEGALFLTPARKKDQNADAMHFERIGILMITDSFGGASLANPGGTFISILDSATTTLIGNQTESMTNSLYYNEEKLQGAGDYSYPLMLINNIFELPIILNARRTVVSTGNVYGEKTFTADDRVRVYSTGDRFCYDSYNFGCRSGLNTPKGFDNATIVFKTGQLEERQIKGFPAEFGTDVEFNGTVKMPSLQLNALPRNRQNGTMVYCSNCRRNSTPCQAGGGGAPAMVVNNEWSCL